MQDLPSDLAPDPEPPPGDGLQLWLKPTDVPALRECDRLASPTPAPRVRLRTLYFDTPDLAFARGGFTLRVRRVGNRHVQTVEGVESPLPESRTQVEGAVPALEPDLERIPGAELRDTLRALAGEQALRPIVEIETLRTEHRVTGDEGEIQVAIDEGRLRTSRGTAPIAGVELSLLRGREADLYRLALDLQQVVLLRISTHSALDRGLGQLTGVAPEPQRATRIELPVEASLEQTLEATFRSGFEQILANEEPARLGLDPESVHQMRVGARRMRSALSLFKDALPASQRRALQPELRWLASELGRARDLDVFLEETLAPLRRRFPEDAGIKHLADEAREMRDAAYDALRLTLDSLRYAELMLRIGGWLAGRGWRDQPLTPESASLFRPARAIAASLLRKRRRKVRRLVRDVDDASLEALHEIRIEAKKLRYATEFLRPLFPESKPRRFVGATRALQDTLGHLNDTRSASELLDEILARRGEPSGASLRAVGFVEGGSPAAPSFSSPSCAPSGRNSTPPHRSGAPTARLEPLGAGEPVPAGFARMSRGAARPSAIESSPPRLPIAWQGSALYASRGSCVDALSRKSSLPEPRAVLARVQPPGPGHGPGPVAPPARAHQVPRHLQQQPRRVLQVRVAVLQAGVESGVGGARRTGSRWRSSSRRSVSG